MNLFHAGDPVQVDTSYFKERTALETAKRAQPNGYSPTSLLLW